MMRVPRKLVSLLVVGMLLASFVPVSAQTAPPDEPLYPVGNITLTAKSLGAGLGFDWGSATMKFQGKEYQLKVTGLNVGHVGFAKLSAVGEVYNLTKPEDVVGNYTSVGAGLALAGGAAGLMMRNRKGVVIALRVVQQGVDLKLGAQGFKIDMK